MKVKRVEKMTSPKFEHFKETCVNGIAQMCESYTIHRIMKHFIQCKQMELVKEIRIESQNIEPFRSLFSKNNEVLRPRKITRKKKLQRILKANKDLGSGCVFIKVLNV